MFNNHKLVDFETFAVASYIRRMECDVFFFTHCRLLTGRGNIIDIATAIARTRTFYFVNKKSFNAIAANMDSIYCYSQPNRN